MGNNKEKPHLREYRFKPLGNEPLSRTAISMKLPRDLDAYIRSLPNRNQWLIEAVLEKVMREKA